MTEEIIERLRSLDLSDGGSHLSAIASCFYQPTFGWTGGSCEILRDLLIEILEGKDVNDDNDHAHAHGCDYGHHRCDQHQVSYDELGNERHKAIAELRKLDAKDDKVYICSSEIAHAIGLDYGGTFLGRLIHLLGGDECNFSGVESYMDAMGGKSNPAETSDESTDHVTLATPSSEDETYPNPVRDASIIDKLDNERHKAIAGLRKVCTKLDESVWTWIEDVAIAIGAQDKQSDKYESMLPEITDRLIHLLGGDQPTLSDLFGILQDGEESENRGSESTNKMTKSAEIAKPESEDGGEVTITDELREFATDTLLGYASQELHVERITAIADRIDEQFDRICTQHEAVLQHTIDTMVDERDELQEKCDRLKAKVEHQREQLAVYATMYDFDAIRALKRERNEHKHRADNAEGHVKSLERRLDAAHETYCALLNDAAREFRAMTEERDELQASLRKIAERAGVPHDGDLSEYGDKKITNAVIGQLGETKQYVKSLEWVRDRRLPRIEAKRDELLAKLDDYDKTHVELPKDENDEYIHVEDVMDGYGKTIEVVELRYGRSGWMLISRDGNGYADTFAFEHHREPTVEQVIRDLTLGKITEAQAIERIEGINGQG